MKSIKGFRTLYTRKTTDEYQIFIDFGEGYFQIGIEDTRKEANETVKLLKQNYNNPLIKIIKKRKHIIPDSQSSED
jgi:hypothetical protein